MRLESITLHGFKSFAERTTIKVLPGITAIVGPNGTGKCVSGETPVLLADGRLVAIRTLVDSEIARASVLHRFDDGVAAVASAPGTDVLSLDTTTLRLEPRRVEAFIKRKAPPFLLRVRTRSGREIDSTHYHPFFTLERGSLEVLTAERLTAGVRIAVPRTLPVKPIEGTAINAAVLSSFSQEDRVFVPNTLALEEWLEVAATRAGGWSELSAVAAVSEEHLCAVLDGTSINIAAVGRIASRFGSPPLAIEALQSSSRATIRVPQEMDGRLARFLGYLVAEGSTTPDWVDFVNNDREITAEFAALAAELFGIRPRHHQLYPTAVRTVIYSRVLCLLLDRIFGFRIGGRSAEKTAPPQIWAAPDHVVAEFLSGLFEGDAHIHIARDPRRKPIPYVEYVTASRRLADDVTTLLLRLGVFPQVRRRVKYAANTTARRRRTYYVVYVYGLEQVQRLAGLLRFVGAKRARLEAALRIEAPSNPNLDVVPGATVLVREAIRAGGLAIKPLRPLSPKLAAYTEGRCEPSRAGLLEVARLVERHGKTAPRAAHVVRRLRALAESDVYWDEVVSIERITPPEPWVYDLTVADTHNFVAANIIAHNSNISESVRWALGEQSAKSLRGQRMEDLIFQGSASRKPVGMAEVELLFSNDGALAVPWSEVAVSRRLYRTGESEYLLNRNVTRLRDILDLFAGTGANPRAYSVMDQDKLNHVLTAKPHERRVFIEEAAGIARYKQQRHETEGKLDAARQNLHRVKDVMQEVQRQLGSLERQARKAQQYKALEAERRDLALALLAAGYAALKTEAERWEAELARLRLAEEELQGRITHLGAREARQQEVIQASEHRLADLRQAAHKVQGELERLLERREQMGLQMQEAAEESGRLEEEAHQAGARLHGIVDERERTRAALADAGLAVAARQHAVAGLEAALERQRADLTGERDRLEALRLEQIRLAAERTDLVRSAGELRERASQCRRRGERLAAELAEAESEAARLRGERGALETAQERTLEALSSLTTDRERLAALLADEERAAGTAESELAEARLQLAGRRSSLEALHELERGREGYGSGVRAVFAEGPGAGLAGIVGTVADLLDVPPELERPVAAVLGERLQWIVVERFEHARAAVGFLRARQAGSATFVPLEDVKRHAALGSSPEDNGVRWLIRSVRASAEGLLDHLLGLVGVVEHLDHAEALWRRNGVVATYVTPDGDVLGPLGHLRGGGDEAAGASEHALLARKRQVRELEEIVRGLQAQVARTQEVAARLGTEAASLRARLAACDDALGAHQALRLAGEKDLEQLTRERERVYRHLETIRVEAGQTRREIEETEATLAVLDQRITAARDVEGAHEVAQASLRETIDAAQAHEASLVAELTAGRVEVASGHERVESLERELGRLDQLEAVLHDNLAQTAQRQQQLVERRQWLAAERDRTDAQAHGVAVERDRVQADEQAAADRHAGLVEELRAIQEEGRGVEGERRRITTSMHEVELAATEGRVRREELLQDAVRAYGVDEPALLARHDPTRELATVRARHAELEDKLAAMGPVNLVADEEYRELDERLTFLRTQHDDLVGSIKDLEKALRGMTRTAQERFDQAFAEINLRFGEIFERLFEGGRAELRLVEAEGGGDPLDTGVDLMAQPRGKRLQSVTLMSGGERALTGLALLFAIFYHRPSPFCVLDEVDAPLDDANIHRFLRVLRELTSQTQFLVITHNRKTMEAADVLYGVTMQEPGLSTLVSVNLRDV